MRCWIFWTSKRAWATASPSLAGCPAGSSGSKAAPLPSRRRLADRPAFFLHTPVLRPMTKQRRVTIVGGGPGGLCTAMLLAYRGFAVTLLEKRSSVGGRTGGFRRDGYTFDVGSTLLMMRFVVEEMYELVGRRLADHLRIVPIDPMYRLDFGDRSLNVSSDASRMEDELQRFAPSSRRSLQSFLRSERNRLSHLYPMLQREWSGLRRLVSPSLVTALPHVGLRRSIHDVAGQYFSDPDIQLAFSFQSAYLGMSPWSCPAGFAMVPYVEHAWGIDHIEGGIHQLTRSMEEIAMGLGVHIRRECCARRLIGDKRHCRAVELASGERIETDDVVINADAVAALLGMLDDNVSLRFCRPRLRRMRESCSTFMLYLGLDTRLALDHHTFFFAADYRAEMDRVFGSRTLADDFSLYVCNPSATDSTMAPPGHSALYVLALVPNTRADIDWRTRAPQLREQILDRLERRASASIRPHIQVSEQMTPTDWADRYHVSHGAVFGLSHSIDQMLAFRLPNRLPAPRNVYLTGGSTSPGSGLPTILESARIAARLICERHGVFFPPPRPLPPPGGHRPQEVWVPGPASFSAEGSHQA
ncbi:MAG: phytoene desaturase [Myxococcales bacterium FL481]|nr:MAG: phytoene desaturase [Myxococcales bacterium FL481]